MAYLLGGWRLSWPSLRSRLSASRTATGDAVAEGGVFFDTGDEVWKLLEQSGVEPWRINEAFMRRQLEAGVERIEFVGEDIFSVINSSDDRIRNSYRAREIRWLLGNADDYGYELIGNVWVKR